MTAACGLFVPRMPMQELHSWLPAPGCCYCRSGCGAPIHLTTSPAVPNSPVCRTKCWSMTPPLARSPWTTSSHQHLRLCSVWIYCPVLTCRVRCCRAMATGSKRWGVGFGVLGCEACRCAGCGLTWLACKVACRSCTTPVAVAVACGIAAVVLSPAALCKGFDGGWAACRLLVLLNL